MRSRELKRGKAAWGPRIGGQLSFEQGFRPAVSPAHVIPFDDNSHDTPPSESSPPEVRTPRASGRDVRWGVYDLLLFLIPAVLFATLFLIVFGVIHFR